MTGIYDLRLVALSVVVAAIASYAALDLAGRVSTSKGKASAAWLLGGALAMGTGIWSMHFIGMLAFNLPVKGIDPIPDRKKTPLNSRHQLYSYFLFFFKKKKTH